MLELLKVYIFLVFVYVSNARNLGTGTVSMHMAMEILYASSYKFPRPVDSPHNEVKCEHRGWVCGLEQGLENE